MFFINFYQIKKNINYLITVIKYFDKLYYQYNVSEVSDKDYDLLNSRLVYLEKIIFCFNRKDSPTKNVGVFPLAWPLKKYQHKYPMLSLDNILSKLDFSLFVDKCYLLSNVNQQYFLDFFVEPKFDGLSVSLIYMHGYFVKAITRGNGVDGEVVTHTVDTIKDIPNILNINNDIVIADLLEVRGEIYIEKVAFQALNKRRKYDEKYLFSNSRNAASGFIRAQQSFSAAKNPLRFFAYSADGVNVKTQSKLLNILKLLGFTVCNRYFLNFNFNKINFFYEYLLKLRDRIPYDIDGVVCKINLLKLQKRLGFVSRFPRFAIACKFSSIYIESYILDIIIQVSRTGILTPVAELIPVSVGGVVISRATLYNLKELSRKNIQVGNRVLIKRSGDVIPNIISVIMDQNYDNKNIFVFPNRCPVCNSIILYYEYIHRCLGNFICDAQILGQLYYFISKKSFHIQGFGIININILYRLKIIKSIIDIFNLEDINKFIIIPLEVLEGWGYYSTIKLFLIIQKHRMIYLSNFIYSLGIPNIGEKYSIVLSLFYVSCNIFINQTVYEKDVMFLDGIGIKILRSLSIYMLNSNNKLFVNKLLNNHLIYVKNDKLLKIKIQYHFFSNKKIIFTGGFRSFIRDIILLISKFLLIKVIKVLSEKSDFLIVGIFPGFNKVKRSINLGVLMLDESTWLSYIFI